MFSFKSVSALRLLWGFAMAALLAVAAQAQVATRFVVTETGGNVRLGTTPIQAGQPVFLRVTAVDDTGATITNYNRRVTIQLAEPRVPSGSWGSTTAVLSSGVVDGVVIFPIYAGTNDRRITVTDGNIATYDAAQRLGDADGVFTIRPAGFEVTLSGATATLGSVPYTYVTGGSTEVRVRALNANGTTAETYVGTVTLTSNNGTFSPVDVDFYGSYNSYGVTTGYTNGVVDKQILTFTTAGVDSISASDTEVTTSDASGSFTVSAPAVDPNQGRLVISNVAATTAVYPGGTVGIKFSATNPQSGSAAAQNVPAVPAINVDGPIDYLITVFSGGNTIVTAIYRGSGVPGAITKDTVANFETNVVIPAYASPGDYSIRVSVSQAGSGTLTVSGQPDLAITTFNYAPGQYRGGDALRFDMTWSNYLQSPENFNSLVGALVQYRVEIHLSANSTFGDADDLLVWQGSFYGNDAGYYLLGGQSVSISDSFLLPRGVPGNFFLLAKINSAGGRVSATDSTLNFSSGFSEVIGPTPGELLENGNNIILALETAKITLLPEKTPDTTRISLTSSGGQSAGLSDQPVINQNGRYVAFQSRASLDSTGAAGSIYNIFLRDVLLNSTTIQSRASNNGATNADCIHPRISSDARYIVYQSAATNIVNGDTNGYSDIFIRDTQKNSTVRIRPSTSTQGDRDSSLPDISGDGRFIVFESNATNFIEGSNPFGLRQIYLYDRDVSNSGVFDVAGNTAFTQVSKTASGSPGVANSATPRISRDGQYVVYSTTASNLIGSATPFSQVIRWTRATGALSVCSTSTTAELADGDTAYPVINNDGSYIVYASRAQNLTSDSYLEGIPHLFRAHITAGLASEVVRIDGYVGATATAVIDTAAGTVWGVNLTNSGLGYSSAPTVTITGGGGSGATATASIDSFTGKVTAITLTNPGSGYTSVPLITIGTSGLLEPDDGPFHQYLDLGSFEPAISDDGQFVTYVSESVNLLPPVQVHNLDRTTSSSTEVQNYEDRNKASDVYVTDLTNPKSPLTNRVSISSFGFESAAWDVSGYFTTQIVTSRSPAMSGDGGYITFTSDAKGHSGLVFGETNFDYVATNGVKDIYIYNAKRSLPTVVTDLPEVTLTIPSALTISANLDLPLTATVTSSPRSITQVEFYADGLLIATATAPTSVGTGEYAGTFAVSALNINGSRTFEVVAVAVDSLGARSLESNVSLVTVMPVVGSLPSVSITSPETSTTTVSNASTLMVQANASDADGTVTSVTFYMDGVLVATGVADGTFKYQASFSTSSFVPGTHSLTARAMDNSGNTVVSSAVSVVVSSAVSEPPTVVLSAVPATLEAGLNIPLKGTATPASGQKISSVKIYSNGLLVASSNNGTSYDTAAAGAYSLSFTFTPDTPNISYSLYVVATDYAGNSVTSVTKTVQVGPAAPDVAKETVDAAYQSLFLRDASSDEVLSAINLYGNGVTDAQIVTQLIQSSEYRDGGAEIILTYLAVWGRYPSYDEYSALLVHRAAGGTDVDLVQEMFDSPDYLALYGDLDDLSTTQYAQYGLIKKFAQRTFKNLYGAGISGVKETVYTRQLFNSISTQGSSPALALVSFINNNLGGGKSGVILTKLRIAGAIMTVSDKTPTVAEVNALVNVPLLNIAEYYSTGTSSAAFLPIILAQPVSTTQLINTTATFKIEVMGYPAPTIKWYKKGSKVVLATGDTLTVTSLKSTQYIATVSNSVKTINSTAAKLKVTKK